MREPAFIKKNAKKWKLFERQLKGDSKVSPDKQAELFVQLTDDLAYAKTFFPKSKITIYLNELAAKVHQSIYRNKREEKNRILHFWKTELPTLFYDAQKEFLVSFVIFTAAILIGVISSANDANFVRLIMGDSYVNMTIENIENGDPMAVYKHANEIDMFLGITVNNVRVSFMAFIFGVLFSFGTAYFLVMNGIMLGAFQYFFYEQGLFLTSFLTIWIHGTLEISAIIIAGCAGFVMGNSILFPGTLTRSQSFVKGAKKGVKIIIGLVPIFILAGFLEGFVTRHTELPNVLRLGIIVVSLTFILWYFVVYPMHLNKRE